MNRYFFNYREGDELSPDRVGMYLPDLDAAREEGFRIWRDLLELAEAQEDLSGRVIEIIDASGEPVLTIPLKLRATSH